MADPGPDALAQMDRALAARPGRDDHALAGAVRSLADLRDEIILQHRRDGGDRLKPRLERINAVISVVMAAEFPIGETPWAELEKARDWLAAIIAEIGTQ